VAAVAAVAAAEKVTFIVSPDTHFTQCGEVADVSKNAAGIGDINRLPGTVRLRPVEAAVVQRQLLLRCCAAGAVLSRSGCSELSTGWVPPYNYPGLGPRLECIRTAAAAAAAAAAAPPPRL